MPESMVAPEAARESLRLEQRADLKSFLGLSLKNGLLNLVTLTLYRFWGKTEVRRRLWTSTYLNDEPFEYRGRGIELFIGFLIALGLGAVFLGLVFAVQFLGPLAALLILPAYIGLMALIGFALFAAFRYMASRTAWRGVRFHLAGSGVKYGFRYLGYIWLSALTLGWFWPAAQIRLAAPLWSGLHFGDRRFAFDMEDAKQENVYGPFLIMWAGMIVLYLGFAGVAFALFAASDFDPEQVSPAAMMALNYGIILFFALAVILLSLPYRTAMMRCIARGIRFDGVKVRLEVRTFAFGGLFLSNIVLLAISLGFLMPFVQARTAKFIFSRVKLVGDVDFAAIHQSRETGPRQGEGLADAFGLSIV